MMLRDMLRTKIRECLENYDFSSVIEEAFDACDVECLICDALDSKLANTDFTDLVYNALNDIIDDELDDFDDEINDAVSSALF